MHVNGLGAGRAIRRGMTVAVRFFEDKPAPHRQHRGASARGAAAPRVPGTALGGPPEAAAADPCDEERAGEDPSHPRYMRPLLRSPTYTTRILRQQGPRCGLVRRAPEPPELLRIRKVTAASHPSLLVDPGLAWVQQPVVPPPQSARDPSAASRLQAGVSRSAGPGALRRRGTAVSASRGCAAS